MKLIVELIVLSQQSCRMVIGAGIWRVILNTCLMDDSLISWDDVMNWGMKEWACKVVCN